MTSLMNSWFVFIALVYLLETQIKRSSSQIQHNFFHYSIIKKHSDFMYKLLSKPEQRSKGVLKEYVFKGLKYEFKQKTLLHTRPEYSHHHSIPL